jgi:hypothetical protein
MKGTGRSNSTVAAAALMPRSRPGDRVVPPDPLGAQPGGALIRSVLIGHAETPISSTIHDPDSEVRCQARHASPPLSSDLLAPRAGHPRGMPKALFVRVSDEPGRESS